MTLFIMLLINFTKGLHLLSHGRVPVCKAGFGILIHLGQITHLFLWINIDKPSFILIRKRCN